VEALHMYNIYTVV